MCSAMLLDNSRLVKGIMKFIDIYIHIYILMLAK